LGVRLSEPPRLANQVDLVDLGGTDNRTPKVSDASDCIGSPRVSLGVMVEGTPKVGSSARFLAPWGYP
jgi:hypothetical protein